jgi:type I restriction enzyme, S subunit
MLRPIEFERRLGVVNSRIEATVQETLTLSALRDTLLPKLISGELRVKDAERFMERAV